MLGSAGVSFYNPDEVARRARSMDASLSTAEANVLAWQEGKRLLLRAINERLVFAFETTLGGSTITSLLEDALAEGIDVRIWYVGLTSPELHIERVRARVARGGHDIPESKIRERYDRSREHLMRLIPNATEVRVFDNSRQADPNAGVTPSPTLLLHITKGRITEACGLVEFPAWAKPILVAALAADGSETSAREADTR